MIDWDATFESAHLNSGPSTHGLTISKSNPSGRRNIYADDKKEIHAAASAHGYGVVFDNAKIISFIKPITRTA